MHMLRLYMAKIPYDIILQRIHQATKLSTADIEKRIERKLNELSGLLTKQGAAQIIANQLGVDLLPKTDGPIPLNEIYEGMTNLTIDVQLIDIYEPRTFTRNDKQGQVRSMLVGDSTDRIRVSVWNDVVEQTKSLEPGMILRINRLTARTNRGRTELSAADGCTITPNPQGITIDNIAPPKAIQIHAPFCLIKDVTTNTYATLLGVVVQTFRPNFYTTNDEQGYVTNAVIDDGTQTIRVVLFKEAALAFFNITHDEMIKLKDDQESQEQLRKKPIGHYIEIQGRVTQNTMYDRLEIVASQISWDIDVKKYIEKIKTIPPSSPE